LKRILLALAVVGLAVVAWGVLRKSRPPVVRFARAARQNLVSSLPTNGKAEPVEWQAVNAEVGGLVSKVLVREGQTVASGAELATVADPALGSEIEAGEAKVAEARANVSALEAGGRPAEVADIESNLARARLNVEQEQRAYDSLQRLVQKQAATREEADAARGKLRQSQLEIENLEKRRLALVAATDVTAARARLQQAQTALDLARKRAAQASLRAPIAGVIYSLAVRPGMFLAAGAPIANIGRVDRLRVRVYVDEPELGRVAEGDPVAITWDALAGRRWQGKVERKPLSIQTLGSRQVGEVLCVIENPNRELPIGANLNAEIRAAEVPDALAIPKEALRRDADGDHVLLLSGDQLERRPVRAGISSVSFVEVAGGLNPGDAVALPSETALKPGLRVTPAIR
jgi:HlyD family secretion protein